MEKKIIKAIQKITVTATFILMGATTFGLIGTANAQEDIVILSQDPCDDTSSEQSTEWYDAYGAAETDGETCYTLTVSSSYDSYYLVDEDEPPPYQGWKSPWNYVVITGFDEWTQSYDHWNYTQYTYTATTPEDCTGTDADGDGDYDCNDPDDNDPLINSTDYDGDGISNDYDPTPNEAEVLEYYIAATAYDENGDLIYAEVYAANEYGEIVDVITYGDEEAYNMIENGLAAGTATSNVVYEDPFEHPDYYDILDQDELESFLATDQDGNAMELALYPTFDEENTSDTSLAGDQTAETDPGSTSGTSTATTDPGATTTTDTLDYSSQFGVMIANQTAQIENQKDYTGQLSTIISNQGKQIAQGNDIEDLEIAQLNEQNEINDNLEKINSTLDEIAENSATGGEGLSQEETTQAVEDALANHENTALGLIDLSEIDPEVTSDEIPDDYETETDITTVLDDIEDSSGVTSYIENLLTGNTLTSTGNCSIDFDYMGKTVSFTCCSFADELQTFGILMQSLVGLNCLLIIFRRR
jgi:hypothetical protein